MAKLRITIDADAFRLGGPLKRLERHIIRVENSQNDALRELNQLATAWASALTSDDLTVEDCKTFGMEALKAVRAAESTLRQAEFVIGSVYQK